MGPDSQDLYDIIWPVGSVTHALPELPDGVNAVWQRTPYTDRAGAEHIVWTRTDDKEHVIATSIMDDGSILQQTTDVLRPRNG